MVVRVVRQRGGTGLIQPRLQQRAGEGFKVIVELPHVIGQCV